MSQGNQNVRTLDPIANGSRIGSFDLLCRKKSISCFLVLIGLFTSVISSPSSFAQAQPQSGNVQALFFTGQHCPPCHQMRPTINHLIGKGFPIRPVDAATSMDLVRRFRVTVTPTIVVLNDGAEVGRQSGIMTAYQVTNLLMRAGYQADQNVLTKPNLLTTATNWVDRAAAQQSAKKNHLAPTSSIPNRDFTKAEKLAMQASVRIKVRYRSGNSIITDFGTGTVIHRHNNDVLILTCGHIFRDCQGKAETVLELGFKNGRPSETVKGHLLRYDADAADVALIAATTQLPIKPIEIESKYYAPGQAAKVFSLGCDHGNPLTVRRGRYINSAMIGSEQKGGGLLQATESVLKYDVSGRPATGRSGGGLYSTEGKLIGVCNAAMVKQDKGVYSAIPNVHQLLNDTNLASLFGQQPRSGLGDLSRTQLAAVTGTNSGRFRPVVGGASFQIPSDGDFLVRQLNQSRLDKQRLAIGQRNGSMPVPSNTVHSPSTRPFVMRGQSR